MLLEEKKLRYAKTKPCLLALVCLLILVPKLTFFLIIVHCMFCVRVFHIFLHLYKYYVLDN